MDSPEAYHRMTTTTSSSIRTAANIDTDTGCNIRHANNTNSNGDASSYTNTPLYADDQVLHHQQEEECGGVVVKGVKLNFNSLFSPDCNDDDEDDDGKFKSECIRILCCCGGDDFILI